MERAVLHHHRFSPLSNSHPLSLSSMAAPPRPLPLHLHAPPPLFPCPQPAARLHLLLPPRFPPRARFRSLFLSSIPFLPFPLLPRCPKHGHLAAACISSSVFAAGAGGGGHGVGGGYGGGGGGHGGGDGSVARGNGAQAVGPESDDIPLATSVEDAIFLDVGGMSCGGCTSSVKKILESQPHVIHASVNLATESAVVKVSLGSELIPGNTKRDVGEALAKHLSSCGFKSSVREEPIGG